MKKIKDHFSIQLCLCNMRLFLTLPDSCVKKVQTSGLNNRNRLEVMVRHSIRREEPAGAGTRVKDHLPHTTQAIPSAVRAFVPFSPDAAHIF
ncbi:hypothetical protein [Enterobacter asburiae]|uniref:hypothetical protein n=1 Tax=Enterobacter asburiae TaxID=61645 RepID=UPI0011D265EB|nr:hypothetical protein [Enterobacter asburiae]